MTTPDRPRTPAERKALFLAQPTANLAEQDARRIYREARSDDPGESLQVIARALGHGRVQVERTVAATRWFSWCECGFVSTTRNTEQDAAGAAVHHVRLAMAAWRRLGVPLAAMPPAPPADWERVRRRNRHFALKRDADASRGVSDTDTPRRATG